MLPRVLVRDGDSRRLQVVLAVLFVALAVPTGAVIWQAWSRLKWEAFHQYRTQAEELARRIDSGVGERLAAAEGRSFADFSFLNVGGDAGAGFLQRSALSAYPVVRDLPGTIGYFQVDAEGRFSTPLLPDSGTDPATLGIGNEEFETRLALTRDIQRILADNRLVGERTAGLAPAVQPGAPAESAPEPAAVPSLDAAREVAESRLASAAPKAAGRQDGNESYSQQVFDELRERELGDRPAAEDAAQTGLAAPTDGRAKVLGKVRDLELDEALNRKSESLEEAPQVAGSERSRDEPQPAGAERSRRLEQATLLESSMPRQGAVPDGPAAATEARITTFESEVDPYEFSLLGSGHFVLFRNVWRGGERYVQGALIEPRGFLDEVFESAFRATRLSAMSDLVVGYRGDVIAVVRAEGVDGSGRYPAQAPDMQGALLYRSRLSAPLDSLELIFSVSRLPPGPGAGVLGWTTLLLAAVFLGGFYALYRLGMGQIRLARQQQDFVAAVSHELKTPLTSIRMYGEMLREGWVDEARRARYYEYIHDESERLTRLIENVLQLARITRNGPRFDLKPAAAGELLDEVRAKLANQVERAGFELVMAGDAEVQGAVILVDRDCFLQIVINLVDNAIKFSKHADTRRIDVGCRPERGGLVRFFVRDYGPGIPRDQMKKIFRLFYRTESELTRETVGTGIGLAIVSQLATGMAGKVDVLNRDPGAEFGVSFPATAD